MAAKLPTDADRAEAISRLLSGLARGDDARALAAAVEDLHPRNNTFPGEVFMRLAADALALAGAGPDEPVEYDGLRENYLAEYTLKGKQNSGFQLAVLSAAALRGGIEMDLLDETYWQADGFWWYAMIAAVAIIRACADRQGLAVPDFVRQLENR